MKILTNPPEVNWPGLIKRPQLELEFLESAVRNTLNRVRLSGDRALRELTMQFDGVDLRTIKVTVQEFDHANSVLDQSLRSAIQVAASNIRKFHELQKREILKIETMPGVSCWRKSVPIQKVGVYIPGGTAPLFSTVLMLGIPASLAGCKEVILCTPPNKDGTIHPAILYAAAQSGIKDVFKVGGAQAIAAMAFGTETIPAVYKVFGPGNQYVTKAKQMVNQDGIAIDLPAGPSEVMVIVDASADASFVASDLLSQAEHGPDSQVVLISLSEPKVKEVNIELERQLSLLPRQEIARQALQNSLSIYFSNENTALAFVNDYAPEHLIINTRNCDQLSEDVVNAGSVFLGPWSPEAIGDYASGTNHTLPTNGHAKAYSGVSLESFTKTITYQQLTSAGFQTLGPFVEIMAEAEQLAGHKRAISTRLNKLL